MPSITSVPTCASRKRHWNSASVVEEHRTDDFARAPKEAAIRAAAAILHPCQVFRNSEEHCITVAIQLQTDVTLLVSKGTAPHDPLIPKTDRKRDVDSPGAPTPFDSRSKRASWRQTDSATEPRASNNCQLGSCDHSQLCKCSSLLTQFSMLECCASFSAVEQDCSVGSTHLSSQA